MFCSDKFCPINVQHFYSIKDFCFIDIENEAKVSAFMRSDGIADQNFQKGEWLTDNELNLTATYIIALANEPNAQEKIKLLLTSLLASYQQEDFFHEQKNKQKLFLFN